MQTQGGQEAEDVIRSAERTFTPRLLVDWNRNGQYDHPLSDMSSYCSRIVTDRNLKGSAPEEITLISGSAAAELTATVSGEHDGLGLVGVFSTYNGNSPFYLQSIVGCEVTYSIELQTALGTVSYPQFVGLMRSASPNRGDGSVELVALDRVELLRSPLTLPSWALSRYWRNRGRTRAQLCDAQWVVDYALRQCDVSPTGQALVDPLDPLIIDEQYVNIARFFLSGTGSIAPGVGSFDNFGAQTFPDTEGGAGEMYVLSGVQPDSLRGVPGNPRPLCFENHTDDYTNKFWVDSPNDIVPDWTHYFSVQLATHTTSHLNANGAPLIRVRANFREMELYVDSGDVYGVWRDLEGNQTETSAPHPIPSGQDSVWVEFGIEWTSQNGLRMYFAFDREPTAWEYFPSVADPPEFFTFDELSGLVTVNRVVNFNDLAYQQNYWANALQTVDRLIRPALYQAVLDPSNNRFTNLPDKQGVDAWDVIGEVADAEFASAFWDEQGIFRFWTYDRVIGLQDTVVRTLTLDDVTGLQTTESLDSVRNIWSVTMKRSTGVFGMVLDEGDADAVYIPPNTRLVSKFWKSNIVFPNPYGPTRCTTIGGNGAPWNDTITHGFVPQWLIGGVWQEVDNRLLNEPIFCFIDRDGYLSFSIANDFNEPLRCATNDGNGALRIEGSYVEQQDEFTTERVKPDSIVEYGKRNINLSGDWYQDEFQTSRLLDLITDRTAEPIPATESITIAGDPRLQLADTIEIVDPHGVGERLKLQVFGIRREFDKSNGLTDELKVELVRPAGQGIWNSYQYGRWDETLVWS